MLPDTKSIARKISPAFALPSDFCQLFSEEMDSLYLLAFLLTADRELAEQCFTSALSDCQKASGVFKGWTRVWARRAIIKSAIRMMRPSPMERKHRAHVQLHRHSEAQGYGVDERLTVVTGLDTFERFVFVMSVLESYPDQDCKGLLGCLRGDVAETRIRALEHIGNSAQKSNDREYRRAPVKPIVEAMAVGKF